MAVCDLTVSADFAELSGMLAFLSEASDRSPEFRNSLLGLLNSGEQLFAIDNDVRTVPGTGELIIAFKPSDSLLGLLSAFRASNPDILIFEHESASRLSSEIQL